MSSLFINFLYIKIVIFLILHYKYIYTTSILSPSVTITDSQIIITDLITDTLY